MLARPGLGGLKELALAFMLWMDRIPGACEDEGLNMGVGIGMGTYQSTPFTSAANGRPIEGTVRQNHAILREVSRVTLVEELVAPRPEK